MTSLVECVPNFSEGRDRRVIEAIARTISGTSGVQLLDTDAGADTNRTVYTFVGPPDAVVQAAFNAAAAAVELIDMSQHQGAHPRIGSMDVCPFVPVAGISMAECVALARDLGRRIGDELAVPVYFYEHAASRESRRSLASIRTGEYEGLRQRLEDPDWLPDEGPRRFHPRAGAFVVGAREFLLAYNVNLNTTDRRLAHDIALTIRESGRVQRDEAGAALADANGLPARVPGRLKAVRAMGWYIDEYRQAQVSVNLLDFHVTPLHDVFEVVGDEARRRGLLVTGSELVGLTPLAPLVEAGRHFFRRQGKSTGACERDLVAMAVTSLGLNQLRPFDPRAKVIEYRIAAPRPLASMPVTDFADDLSTSSPVPGGGSTAALVGALAAALTAMVGSLIVGKRGREEQWGTGNQVADRSQALKARLLDAIDEDAAAFRMVMEASRLSTNTPEESVARQLAVDRAYERAARVPLQTARSCAEAAELAFEAAGLGHRSSASDVGVAALAARAGAEGAALNVLINLSDMTDAASRDEYRREADAAVYRARRATAMTLDAVASLMHAPAPWISNETLRS